MKREYRDHQGREWFALHVRTGEERDVALAVYGLGDADSLLPVEHYTTRGQERERILMPGYVFVGCVMNADMWQRLRHLRGVLRILGEPYEAIPEEQMTAVMVLYWHGVQGTKVIRQNGVTEVIGGPLLEVTHTITCADARQGVISHGMGHWHSFDSHTHGLGGHRHGMIHRHEFSHYHEMNISLLVPSQTLNLPEHRHSVNIPAHAHDVTLPEHLHGIEYGIYSGPMTSAYTVEVDGKEVPGSAFENGVVDIAPYLSTDADGRISRGTFHSFAVRPKPQSGNAQGLAHIRASWSAQVFISCQTGRQY